MSGQRVHVSTAMIALLAAVIAVFVFIAFFTVYLRHCSGGYALRRDDDRGAAPNFDAFISRSRRQRRPRGLDAEVVEAFPTMKYAEARALWVARGRRVPRRVRRRGARGPDCCPSAATRPRLSTRSAPASGSPATSPTSGCRFQ